MICYYRHCARTIMNLVFDSTKVEWFALYHTNLFDEVLLSFVWLKFSSFEWDINMRWIRCDKTIILGMPKAFRGNIQGRSKQLCLGMPRKASPVSSPTLSVTSFGAMFSFVTCTSFTWSVFYFVRICFLLFRIMFCIFYFNKSGIDSLYYAYFTSLHVVVWKQKVYRTNEIAPLPMARKIDLVGLTKPKIWRKIWGYK